MTPEYTTQSAGSLRVATEALLGRSTDDSNLLLATLEMQRLFLETSNLSGSNILGSMNHRELASGRAVSPRIAMRCIGDHLHTTAFIRGTYDAIREAQRRFPNQKINVLYAGCGPYAPLAMGLTQFFHPDEVEFTLLDIHEISCECVQKTIELLGISEFFAGEPIMADATEYRYPENRPLHIILSEVMNYGLHQEPQVAVTANLAPQLVEGGIFLPEEIELNAYLAHVYDPYDKRYLHHPKDCLRTELGNVMKLNIDFAERVHALISENKAAEGQGSVVIPLSRISIPRELKMYNRLSLGTRVKVFGDHMIDEGQADITLPYLLEDIRGKYGGYDVQMAYEISSNPGVFLS